MIAIPKPISFPLGQIVATPGALKAIRDTGKFAIDYLSRHARGDWGDVCAEDWEANDQSLEQGSRIFSAYNLTSAAKIWIITESDRSSTCVLLPEDY